MNFDASNVTNTALTIAPFGQSITVVSGNNSQTSSAYDNVYLWNQAASYSNLPNYKDISNNTVGSSNTVFGSGALPNYLAYGNTGVNNTAIGYNALNQNTRGSNNTSIGYYSGFTGSTGSYNTMVGYNAGMVIAGLSGYTGNYNYSTALGYNATITDNNQIVLGTTGESTYIPGTLDITGTGNGNRLRYQLLDLMYPLGSVYMNYDSSANPQSILKWPTSRWSAISGSNVLTSYNSGDTGSFNLKSTGGTADVAEHNHQWLQFNSAYTSGNSNIDMSVGQSSSNSLCTYNGDGTEVALQGSGDSDFIRQNCYTRKGINSNTTNGNYPPYTTVAMWRRTS